MFSHLKNDKLFKMDCYTCNLPAKSLKKNYYSQVYTLRITGNGQ